MRHFTTKDGLPSNVIYEIFHDSKGFMWFCTDQGISCFDGRMFRNYSINEGLPDNEVFRMQEDQFSRYWLVCYNHKACYFRDGKIYTAANDPVCRKIDRAQVNYSGLLTDEAGIWYLKGKRLYSISKDDIKPVHPEVNYLRDVYYYADHHFYTQYEGGMYMVSDGRSSSDQSLTSFRLPPFASQYVVAHTGHDKQLYQVSGYEDMYHINAYRLDGDSAHLIRSDRLRATCYAMEYETDTSVLCFTSKGLYDYDVRKGLFRCNTRYPAHIPFNRIRHDREGNTWLSTLNDGVYMQGASPASVYSMSSGLPENDLLAVRMQDTGAVTVCYSNGGFSLIENGRLTNFHQPVAKGMNRIKFACRLRNGTFLAGGDAGLYRVGALPSSNRMLSPNAQKAYMRFGHQYYLAHASGISCFDDLTGKTALLWKERTTAIATSDGKKIWFGSLSGLYCWQSGTVKKFNRDSVLSGNRIISLAYAGSHYLVIATHLNGVYTWDGAALHHIGRREGLASDNCTALCADTGGTIWVCTDKGLDRVIPGADGHYRIHHYSAMDGLPDGKINDVASQSGRLCVATAEGLMILDQKRQPAPVYRAPDVYILSVVLRDTVISWPDNKLIRSYKENSLQINYAGVLLTDGSRLQYRYVLEGGNSDTMYTQSDLINLSNLKPGNYRLLLWARHSSLPGWSRRAAVFSFEIRPPFWLTPWFILLGTALSAAAVFALYSMKVRNVRSKEKEAASQKQHMALLKMQALRSQINPHFMFNALNSIQHFYSRDEDRKANQYMSLFARLIRKTLNHSEQNWLTLAEEVEMQHAYLRLEQMRFRKAFVYEISIDPAVDQQTTMIPSLLIQPYVENAIGHGLRGLQEGQGMLHLAFLLVDKTLVCTIEDNGAGIGASPPERDTGRRKSFGMRLTRQRIETLNALYRTDIRLVVTDRKEQDKSIQGTLITLYIPIRTFYE